MLKTISKLIPNFTLPKFYKITLINFLFMTSKIVNTSKYVGLFFMALMSIIACEKDFENIGVGLVDNNLFTPKDTVFEVIAYNQNVVSSRVDNIPQYLIGTYSDANFGHIKAAFISQLSVATTASFGDDVSIDAVILDIPYYATRQTDNTNGTPNFKLDSILGDQSIEYNLTVHESATFLNTLDPQDITKAKKYYSNETYDKSTELYSSMFAPNKNDTVLYVERRFLDDDPMTVDRIDTIKKTDLLPSIKLPLDTLYFRTKFINEQNSGVFDTQDNLNSHFRGLIIDANGSNGSLMTLAMSDATINVYYTEDVPTDETDTDLNGDGDTNDLGVIIKTPKVKSYPMATLRVNQFVRDYSGAQIESHLSSPDVIGGEEKLYIQGAAGSIAIVELLKGINLDEIRSKNWLINEANLTLYLDEESSNNVPERLYLYRYDKNSQVQDVFTEAAINGIDGFLDRDDDNNPVKYEFSITDYISNVLKQDDPIALERLAIKAYHTTDPPNFAVANDTLIRDFSWTSKGVVLKGNKLPSTEAKRFKLEIFYTINNN